MINNEKHINSGFKTPKDYFNKFEENLFDKLSIEHHQIDTPQETGFEVPENYFDKLEDTLLKKVEQPKPKVISLFNKKQFLYVASIAAILVLSLFIFNPSSDNAITFDDIDYATFEEYLNLQDLDISPNELADLYEIDNNELDEITFVTIDDDNILEYLSNETSAEDYYDNEL